MSQSHLPSEVTKNYPSLLAEIKDLPECLRGPALKMWKARAKIELNEENPNPYYLKPVEPPFKLIA